MATGLCEKFQQWRKLNNDEILDANIPIPQYLESSIKEFVGKIWNASISSADEYLLNEEITQFKQENELLREQLERLTLKYENLDGVNSTLKSQNTELLSSNGDLNREIVDYKMKAETWQDCLSKVLEIKKSDDQELLNLIKQAIQNYQKTES